MGPGQPSVAQRPELSESMCESSLDRAKKPCRARRGRQRLAVSPENTKNRELTLPKNTENNK